MQNVKLAYFESMDSAGEVKTMGTIKNGYVEVHAPFGTDMSYVKVTGKIHEGEGFYQNVEFTLDDARDVEAYKVYKYK